MRKLNGNSLLAYHINPYVRTVALKIADKTICNVNECYGIYSDLSPLKLRNNITLESLKDGWKVKFPEDYVSRNRKQEFNNLIAIANSKNEYWLKETDDKDRIEIAVEFIKALA